MQPTLTFSHSCVILDACCVINLYASGYIEDILRSIPPDVATATFVRDKEATRIYSGSTDPAQKYEAINLGPYVTSGLLRIVSLETEAENISFVNFAAALGGDGEAVTGAIAHHRNWSIGSDDRKALAFFTRTTPQLQLISTLELVKHWADTSNAGFELLQRALRNMRVRARYAPSGSHLLYDWWRYYFETRSTSEDNAIRL